MSAPDFVAVDLPAHPKYGVAAEAYTYERTDGVACAQAKYRNGEGGPKHLAWWVQGSDGEWYLSHGDVKLERLKPYHWQSLEHDKRQHEPIILTEGPKDGRVLAELGFVTSDHRALVAQHTEWYRGRDVIIIPDRDPPSTAITGGGYSGHRPGRHTPGELHAQRALKLLKPVAKRCVKFEIPGDGIKDATDWVRAHPGTPEEKADALRTLFNQAIEQADVGRVPAGRATLIEAIRVIMNDPAGRTVRRNTALGVVEHAGGRLSDSEVIAAKVRLLSDGLKVGTETVREALEWVADQRGYHPVTEHLEALPEWDGEERLHDWIVRYLHAPPSDITRLIGERFMIGMGARGMLPGAELHHSLLLHGPQGVGKTTVAKILGGSLYGELGGSLSDKDTALGLRGKLVVEIAELGPMRRSETEQVKAFLSRSEDDLRAPYGRLSMLWPRSCSFVITTNDEVFLNDPSGGRRFWPVEVPRRVDFVGLAKVRDQLLAEAVARWRNGAEWWPNADEAAQLADAQDELQFEDPWQELINGHVEKNAETSVQRVFDLLNVPRERQDRNGAMRIAACLKLAGLRRRQIRVDGKREWRYAR